MDTALKGSNVEVQKMFGEKSTKKSERYFEWNFLKSAAVWI